MGDQVQGDRVDAVDVAPTPPSGPVSPAGVTRPFTFQLPTPRDPRLHVASILVSVQVLGQVSLGFDLSVAQILVALLTAAAIEIALTARRTRVIAWPASALLTGNGVALLLRVPGTDHGDWFAMDGWYVFAATAALAVLSKYVVRWDDRPLFNPSNFGLVAVFLILGSGIADPQDLWWGPMSPGLLLTYALILIGGVVITRRLRLLVVSAAFWGVFAAVMAVVAVAGHTMTARWSLGPVAGMEYWTTLALSPEILIFLFFMITDPRTAARGRTAPLLYAVAVALTSGVLVAFQTTEYATKVALLTGLVVVCGFRPALERLAPAGEDDRPVAWLRARKLRPVVGIAIVSIAVAVSLVGTSEAPMVEAVGVQGRPELELGPHLRPEVRVGEGIAKIGGSFGEDEAETIATEVVEDIVLADLAAQGDDAVPAEAVATGEFREALEALDEQPPTPAPERTVDSAVVDVVRDPEDFQAIPRISVELEGSLDGEEWSATYHVAPGTGPARIEREVP